MKGTILNFSPQHGQGVIQGEDGRHYSFISQQWHHSAVPLNGDTVEFDIDLQGYAVNIENLHVVPQTATTLNLTKSPELNPYQAPMHMEGVIARQSDNPLWAEEENYGFFDWVKKCLSNYANFSGRARRKEYWYFYLFFILVVMLASFVDSAVGTEGILVVMVILGLLVPILAVSARRLHDINKSGWWMLISNIPIVGFVYLFWLVSDTKPGNNQWGAPARRLP